MQNHIFQAILCTFLSIFPLAGILQDASTKGVHNTSNPPRIVAKLLEDRINKERRLVMAITFVNDSREPITIYKKLDIGLWKGLIPQISDEKGKLYPNMVFGEPVFKEESNEKIPPSDFVTIGPNESFTLKKTIYLQSYLIESPGRYSLTLFYENPLPPKLVPPGITIWDPPSDTVKTEPVYFILEH